MKQAQLLPSVRMRIILAAMTSLLILSGYAPLLRPKLVNALPGCLIQPGQVIKATQTWFWRCSTLVVNTAAKPKLSRVKPRSSS